VSTSLVWPTCLRVGDPIAFPGTQRTTAVAAARITRHRREVAFPETGQHMGLFNTIHATLQCPRCSREADLEIEVKFGWANQIDYTLGDQVRWVSSDEFSPTDRPMNGTGEFAGYCECSSCHKDFWVRVYVDNNRIQLVSVDHAQKGDIP